MNGTHIRYLVVLSSVFGLGLLTVGTINVIVDPFGAYRLIGIESLSAYRQSEYVATAESYRHDRPQSVFVGSSRVLDGFSKGMLDAHGTEVFQVAVRGTSWSEQIKILDYLADSSPGPSSIVFGLDLDTLLRKPRPSDFANSRFNSSLRSADYHGQNLFSFYALRESLEILMGPWQEGREQGIDRIVARLGSHQVFRRQLSKGFPRYTSGVALESVRPAMDELSGLIGRAKQKGIRFKVVVLPIHALAYEKMLQQGYGDYIDLLKREVVRVGDIRQTPVWDFTGFSVVTTEPVPVAAGQQMEWFYDSDHFTPRLGEVILRKISSGVAFDESGISCGVEPSSREDLFSSFGECIHGGNVEIHLVKQREARERYLQQASEELLLIKTEANYSDANST